MEKHVTSRASSNLTRSSDFLFLRSEQMFCSVLASPQKIFCLQVHVRVKLLVVGFQGQKIILFELEDILIHLQFHIML